MTKKSQKAPTKLELKKRAIEALQDRGGRVTPDAVIEAARDKSSVLHDEFEWDQAKAAYAHWVETARRLIREVRFIVVLEDVRIAAPYYTADPGTDEAAYIPTARLAKKHAAARAALADELARIRGAVNRARTLASVFGLSSHFDRLLDASLEIERVMASDESVASLQPAMQQ